MSYQHGMPGWDGAKVNHLLGTLANDETHTMTMPEMILELYSALQWTYGEYRVLRSMVSEMRTIVAPETIPLIGGEEVPFGD